MSLRELYKKIEKLKAKKISTRDLELEFYFKTSIPFAAVCFVILGAPLAINTQRSSKSIGMGISILLIFFYYLLMSSGKALGKAGILPPLFAMWMQNLVIIGIAIFIMKKAPK
jgi:lipopolysaccharide export system permease protein